MLYFLIHAHICPLNAELVLRRHLYVTENHTLQLHYLVNDTTYPGLEGTALLHFNVTILPVHIQFSNISLMFPVTRRASVYAQVHIPAQQQIWLYPQQKREFSLCSLTSCCGYLMKEQFQKSLKNICPCLS